MANSRQSATIFSPSSKRPTKRTRSSITEHSFQGIASSPRGGSVTYVSGTNCHPCVRPLTEDKAFKQSQLLPTRCVALGLVPPLSFVGSHETIPQNSKFWAIPLIFRRSRQVALLNHIPPCDRRFGL